MSNIKITTTKIKFPENQVWLHNAVKDKDGKIIKPAWEELLVEMSDKKLLNIIFPEADKRYQQKHYGALKFSKILDAIISILASRGIKVNYKSLPVHTKNERKSNLRDFGNEEIINELIRREQEGSIVIDLKGTELLYFTKEKQINIK